MKIVDEPFEGLKVIETPRFKDDRGYFMETFQEEKFQSLGLPQRFFQDNFSVSRQGVLRGLHFQKNPHAQGKLVRAYRGKVWDCVVDLRSRSKTFGKIFGIELSDENALMMYVPEGFAHGFCVLSGEAEFAYKCTTPYAPKSDSGIRWNDTSLNIPWPVKNPIVSPKDAILGTFEEATNLF